MLSDNDIAAIKISLQLASVTTLLLLCICVPLALWLSTTSSRLKPVFLAVFALPLVLPPTVIGFYLLLVMGPQGWVGQLTQTLGLGTLPFTFAGLVVGSMIYSLPFVLQPLHNAFSAIGARPAEVAATLGASPWQTLWRVTLPLARNGVITAAILGFAHTLGEFGVILMIGGNIPGETQVISVQIYDHVETLNYASAHNLSLIMVIFSLVVLSCVYALNKNNTRKSSSVSNVR